MLAKLGKMGLGASRLTTILLAVMAAVFVVGGFRLGLWIDGGPGPGLMPSLSAALLLVLLVPMVLGAPRDEDALRWEPLFAVALGGAFALLAPRIGMVAPAVVMITLWVKVLHGQSWLRSGLLGLCLTAAGVLVFHVALKVPMPLLPGVS